ARVRLEGWFAGHAIDEGSARGWASASRSVLNSITARSGTGAWVSAILSRFDALLSEFKVAELAAKSDFSPAGFEQRVRSFADHLNVFVQGTASHLDMTGVAKAIDFLRSHALSADHLRRIERCEMAARLASWMAAGSKLSSGSYFNDQVEGYMRNGGFVDWARLVVQEGDSEPALNKAFDALLTRVEQTATVFEAGFAAKLAEWTKHGEASGSAFLPIEDALEKLVGPVGAQTPVLLLVMDGMSVPVFRELLDDVMQRGKWLECRPRDVNTPAALLAAVPSVTEISRRALFRGELHPESTPIEQSAFGTNDKLFSLCGGQTRPTLFLKGELQVTGEAGVSAVVKNAINSKKCRVVAMVLNAVDDHLSGSDQIAPRWDLDFVRPLREVLQIAAEAGRALIITSDHGHVLEHRTVQKPGMSVGGDRYREDGGVARDGEIVVSGRRVQRAIGREELAVAWSRNIRYAGKKRGYHGGVNPQEMVIPIAVLRHLKNALPDGWTDVSPSPYWPAWWRLSAEAASAVMIAAETKVTAGLDLFTHAAAKAQATEWIEQLLNGEIYAAQCSHAARGAPDRKLVATFLEALSTRGGTMPREALAERLGQPLLRLNGVVANLARVFNVDGFDIVTLDTTSGRVVLDVSLLKKQFAIET
ncbi:MAG TPA: BREX-2 system phosphatase PglZ, partial [Opitutus sp.]|nr:BREX-2 system phosphatase PglZ [Opitutus sp.]